MNAIDDLIRLLKKLPGMGEKSASRLAYHLIKTDESYNKALGTAITEIKDRIHPCPICGCYTDQEICQYCSSETRDKYGIGPESLSFPSLIKRIEDGSFKEIIIATNPTEEGDTTALYIRHLLKGKEGILLTRPAAGLPIGGDLGYADKLTLARSMKGRIRL